MSSNFLKKQLELVRFEKTIDYVTASAGGRKHLNSSELAHINSMLTLTPTEVWRSEPVTVKLPFGDKNFSMITNYQIQAQEIISKARDEANNGDLAQAAAKIYADLVLNHLFIDANRRTAVAAASWILMEHGVTIQAMGLLELGAGDLSEPKQFQALKQVIQYSIDVSRSRDD